MALIPSHLLNVPATVTTKTDTETLDGYGNPETATTATETLCWLHQTAHSDTDAGRDVSDQTWTCYLPAGTTIDHRSTVTVNGVAYEVVGPPWAVQHPTTLETTVIEATLRVAA